MSDAVDQAVGMISSQIKGERVTSVTVDLDFTEICFDWRALRIFVDVDVRWTDENTAPCDFSKLTVFQIRDRLVGNTLQKFERGSGGLKLSFVAASVEIPLGKSLDHETVQYFNSEDPTAYAIIA